MKILQTALAAQKIDTAVAAKRYVVGWLVGLSGTTRGESFPVRIGRNVLGRDRKSDIVINDDQASAHHADLVFRPEERRYILMDHNSTNGTYVNEAEIEAEVTRAMDAAAEAVRATREALLPEPASAELEGFSEGRQPGLSWRLPS